MRCIAMSEPPAARAPQVFGFGALERVLPFALIVGALLACMLPFMQVAPGYHVIAWSGFAIFAALYTYGVVIACKMRIELDDETLVIQGGPIRHVIARRDIQLDCVRRFTRTRLWDLEQPLRRSGFHVPGFVVRRFSGPGQKTVVAVLTANDAVFVPARDFDLVVSPEDIDGFLAALGVSVPPGQE
jgi:hypothetical protein